MKLKNLTIALTGMLLCLPAIADTSAHVGDRVLSKQEFIQRLMPRPQIKTRGIRVKAPQAEPTISMEIKFEFDSAKLTKISTRQLQPLGRALQSDELKNLAFMLEGHTDASGSEHYNMSLSQRRAAAVGRYLHDSFGVAPDRLTLVGKGEYDLLKPGVPYSGINRRVAITTLGAGS